MKAAVIHGPHKVTCDTVDDPKLQTDRDIILKVTATAICGSDLHIYSGALPQPRPMVLGHEFMGVVEEAGKAVTNLKRGDRVVVPFPVACDNVFSAPFSGIPISTAGTTEDRPNMFASPTRTSVPEKYLPSPDTVQRWTEAVKKKFRFCPKISRWVTHAKKLNDPETSCPRFFDVFDPYRSSCGPVLVQLPANLAFNAEKTAHFFSFLRQNYKGWLFSLEARHESWMSPEALSLIKKYKIGWVIAESGNRWASKEIITARHIYLRFHGPDGSYATSYSDQQLRSYARKCRTWLTGGHDLWIFFNNDIQGHAIANARQLNILIGQALNKSS